MNILSAEKISKSYSEKILLQEISFSIQEGEKIGLIGLNGTGKSTLLKLIAGIESPDAGKIIGPSSSQVQYLSQNPLFEEGTTVLEQIFKGSSPLMRLLRDYTTAIQKVTDHPENKHLEKELISLTHQMDTMGAWSLEAEGKSILTKLGITDFQADVSILSGGQRKRIALASALITPADILILDEPTNHIDNDTVDWLEKYLNKSKSALFMVTHDRYFLDRVVSKIIELDRGRIYSYQGNYSKYLEMKAEREEIAESSERKRQKLIRSELEWIRKGAKARTTKQKARIERFEKLIRQPETPENQNIEIQAAFSRLGRKIIELKNISKAFACGEVIKDFSYTLLRDDRIGLIGPNGSGKSTLLKIAAGKSLPDTGSVSIGETVKIGFFSQENDDLNENLRVIEYIRDKAEFITTADGVVSAPQMLDRFLFPPSVQWTPIAKLSGGEKRRLFLLGILMESPNVLLLDEPTNDLDIQTLTILENYLEAFPGAVLVTSHDRYFLDRVVDGIFSFEGHGVIRKFAGNYSDYHQLLGQRTSATEDDNMQTAQQPSYKKADNHKNRKLKFSYNELREFEQIDGLIAQLEADIQQKVSQMNEASSDYQILQQLAEEKEQLDRQLNGAIERWAYLNELAEAIERQKS